MNPSFAGLFSVFSVCFYVVKGKKKWYLLLNCFNRTLFGVTRSRYYTDESCTQFFTFTRTAVEPEGLAQSCETVLNNCNGLQCTRTPLGNQSKDHPQALPQVDGTAGSNSMDGALAIKMGMNTTHGLDNG